MKKRVTVVFFAIAAMIIIPLIVMKNNAIKDAGTFFESKHNSDSLTEAILHEYKEDYCEQGLTALGIILNSGIKAGTNPKSADKNEFIKEYGESTYSKLKGISNKVRDEYIEYKGKPIAVPYAFLSKNADKEYCAENALPWDKLKKDYNKAKSGLSLNSVNALCENGLTAEEALLTFLKNDIKIVKQQSKQRAAGMYRRL